MGSSSVNNPKYAEGVWEFGDDPPRWIKLDTTEETVQVYGHSCVAVDSTRALLVMGGRTEEEPGSMLLFKLDLTTKSWSQIVAQGETVKNTVSHNARYKDVGYVCCSQ